jgi:hypothetical protein
MIYDGTLEPWNFGTLELWNFGTLEPWNLGTINFTNPSHHSNEFLNLTG